MRKKRLAPETNTGRQVSFDDICWRFHGGNSESIAASAVARRKADALRRIIFQFVLERAEKGATCYEIEIGLGIRHATASARCSELKRDGRLIPTEECRKTDTGCNARVLRARSEEIVDG